MFDFGKVGELMKDRNFLSMLAGMGSRFGAGGAGEAIGAPTQQMIQSLATQEAVGKGEAERKAWNQQLLDIMKSLTGKDIPGPTSMKIGPDNMTLDITPPTAPGAGIGAGPTAGAPPVVGATPGSAFAAPATGGFDMKNLFQSIAPFWRALGG